MDRNRRQRKDAVRVYCNFFKPTSFKLTEKLWLHLPRFNFLDINLTKRSRLWLHAIHSPFYWRIVKKTILCSGFPNLYKKSTKQENSSIFMKAFCRTKNEVENKTKTRVWEEKPRLKCRSRIPFLVSQSLCYVTLKTTVTENLYRRLPPHKLHFCNLF